MNTSLFAQWLFVKHVFHFLTILTAAPCSLPLVKSGDLGDNKMFIILSGLLRGDWFL
jgi:hypothetical protein